MARDLALAIAANCSLQPLREPAFGVISAVQESKPGHAVEAIALCLALIAQTNNLDVHELVARARRQIADADAVRSPHVEAIRDFAAGVLR